MARNDSQTNKVNQTGLYWPGKSPMQADASLDDILKSVIRTFKALEDLAVSGFGATEKLRVQTSRGSYDKGDAKCSKKLKWAKRKLLELEENVWIFIETREEEIKGPGQRG